MDSAPLISICPSFWLLANQRGLFGSGTSAGLKGLDAIAMLRKMLALNFDQTFPYDGTNVLSRTRISNQWINKNLFAHADQFSVSGRNRAF